MVDRQGFRANVGIIICDGAGKIFWGKRVGQDAWQFPQGGINQGERPVDALYRELYEEVGLESSDVELLANTQGWLRYWLPQRYVRKTSGRPCIGQKQKWFLLKLTSGEHRIKLDAEGKPEFDSWSWVNYWFPVTQVIEFKREVYRRALKELAPVHCDLEKNLEQEGA